MPRLCSWYKEQPWWCYGIGTLSGLLALCRTRWSAMPSFVVSLLLVWISCLTNNRSAGDSRSHEAHVTPQLSCVWWKNGPFQYKDAILSVQEISQQRDKTVTDCLMSTMKYPILARRRLHIERNQKWRNFTSLSPHHPTNTFLEVTFRFAESYYTTVPVCDIHIYM